jgi:hypothetical protein
MAASGTKNRFISLLLSAKTTGEQKGEKNVL